MNPPIAETVAGPEPEIAAKNMQETTVTIASPPTMKLTRLSAKLTSLFEIPPYPMRDPASMKNGMARSGKESRPVKQVWAIMVSGMGLVSASVMAVESPREIPMGTLSARKRVNRPSRRAISIVLGLRFRQEEERFLHFPHEPQEHQDATDRDRRIGENHRDFQGRRGLVAAEEEPADLEALEGEEDGK